MTDQPHMTVTNIRQHRRQEPDGQGGLHHVWHITFNTPSGTEAGVSVPESQYSPQNVAAQMQYTAQQVEGVHALEGKPLKPVAEA